MIIMKKINHIKLISNNLSATSILGFSSLLLLTACDASYVSESLFATRPNQVVDGARRVPPLNNKQLKEFDDKKLSSMVTHAAAPVDSVAVTEPARTPVVDTKFAPSKSEVNTSNIAPMSNVESVPSPVAVEVTEQQKSSGNYFTRLLGWDSSESEKPVELEKPVVKETKTVGYRKPLPENNYMPANGMVAPVEHAPVAITSIHKKVKTPVVLPASKSLKNDTSPSKDTGKDIVPVFPPVSEKPAQSDAAKIEKQEKINSLQAIPSVSQEDKKLLDKEVLGEITAPVPVVAPEPVVEDIKTPVVLPVSQSLKNDVLSNNDVVPALSSVPEKPAQFDSVKTEHQEKLNELKSVHSIAQEDKKVLDNEVAGVVPAPVVTPIIPLSPPVVEETKSPVAVIEKETAPVKLEIPDSVSASDSNASLPSPSETVVIGSVPVTANDKPLESSSLEKVVTEKPLVSASGKLPVKKSSKKTTNKQSAHILGVLKAEKPAETPVETPVEKPQATESAPVSYLPEVSVPSQDSSVGSVKMEDAPVIVKSSEVLQNTVVQPIAGQPVVERPVAEKPVEEKPVAAQSDFVPASALADTISKLPSPEIVKSMKPSRYETQRTSNSSY